MVVFISGEDEEGVAAIDPISLQAREELPKRRVIGLQGCNVSGLPGAIGRPAWMRIVGIRDVGIGDRDSVLLHRCHISERHRGAHPVKPWKSGDDVAV